MLPGFFSVMLPAYYLSRGIKQYRGVFCVIQLVNMLALSLLIIAIAFTVDSAGFLYSMTVINGFFAISCVPLCYEIVAETGFPKSEALTAGFLHALYAIVRMIMQAMNHLLDRERSGFQSFSYTFLMIVLLFLSFVIMFFAKTKHRRLRIDQRYEKEQKSERLLGGV